jgi:hypothetical protein
MTNPTIPPDEQWVHSDPELIARLRLGLEQASAGDVVRLPHLLDDPFPAVQEQHPLIGADPGSICEDCGHFALRHEQGKCLFPRGSKPPCDCEGFLWLDTRYESGYAARGDRT